MIRLISRLKGTAKVVKIYMIVDLGSHNALKNFGNEVKIGNRTVVLELISIKLGFLKKGSDHCFLENSGARTIGKTAIYNRGNGRGQQVNAIFHKKGGPRVKTGGLSWGHLDSFCKKIWEQKNQLSMGGGV